MKILELGLGQSTKIIGQYAKTNENVTHYVIEHDENWIHFFENRFPLSDKTQVTHCDWTYSDFGGHNHIREYDGFYDKFHDKKFNFIFIDAPLGNDMPDYARIDVLRILPDCLEDSFVIVMDDCNRSGELNTFVSMCELLKKEEIPYVLGLYSGEKDVRMICSKDLAFLASM